MYRKLLVPAAASALLLLQFACSSGPEAPRPGTAGFYWQAAQETYKNGDYAKTIDHLDKLLRNENPHNVDARPWRLTLAAASLNAYRELADNYDQGGRTNKANPAPFRKKGADYRSTAERTALVFADMYSTFRKTQPQGDVNIVFGYPPRGNLSMPAVVTKVSTGAPPSDDENLTAERTMMERAVIGAVCDVTGASKDPARAQQVLQTLPYKAPRATFERGIAEALYQASTLFSPLKGSQPIRQKQLLDFAAQALGDPGDDKNAKELKTKIERDLKGIKKPSS